MREQILADAAYNSRGTNEVIDGFTDTAGQRWTLLKSIGDLDDLIDIMNDDHIKILKNKKRRKQVENDINAGITFGFYIMNEKLFWER